MNLYKNFYLNNKSVLKSTLIKVFSVIATFVMNYLLIQNLGIANSGIVFICINLVVISTTFTQLGFNESIVRFISQLNLQRRYYSISNLMQLVQKYTFFCSLSLSLLLIISSGFINKLLFEGGNLELVLIIFSLSIPFVSFNNIYAYFVRGMGFSTTSLIYLILLLPLFISILLIFFDIDKPLQFGIFYTLSAFIVFLISNHNKESIENKFDHKKKSIFNKKKFLDFSLNAWKYTTCSILTYRITELLVGIFCDSTNVALFTTSLRIANVLNLAFVGIHASIAAEVASFHKAKNINGIKLISKRSIKFGLIFTIPAFLLIFIVPEFFLGIFDEKMKIAANALRIISIAFIVKIATGPNELILSMCGYDKFLVRNLFKSFLVSLILGFALIPFFNIYGASISLASGIIIQDLTCRFKFNKLKNKKIS